MQNNPLHRLFNYYFSHLSMYVYHKIIINYFDSLFHKCMCRICRYKYFQNFYYFPFIWLRKQFSAMREMKTFLLQKIKISKFLKFYDQCLIFSINLTISFMPGNENGNFSRKLIKERGQCE